MEQAMFPQNENNTPFDNEALFDAEGHLTDEGLHALQEGRLDELGSLEAAEHLTFCDYCSDSSFSILASALLTSSRKDLFISKNCAESIRPDTLSR